MTFWERLKRALNILFQDPGDIDYELRMIDLDDVVGNPYQPRSSIDEDKLEELAKSIEEYGVITPIQVMPVENDQYQLVAGERRVRASRSIDKDKIPALIRYYSQDEMFEVSFLDNLHREPMSNVDKAIMYQRLRTEFKNMSVEELGDLIGKSPHEITKREWILDLPPVTKRALNRKIVGEDIAREIKDFPVEEQRKIISFVANKEPTDDEIHEKINEFRTDESDSKQISNDDGSASDSESQPELRSTSDEDEETEDDLGIPSELQDRT
ncbi:MAG: ParB/RepB/Spo0J family partition protein [bacterium]